MPKSSKRRHLNRTWQEIAGEAQEHRDETIAVVEPKFANLPNRFPQNVTRFAEQVLSSKESEITSTKPEDLVQALSSKALSAVEVTTSFLRRATLAQKLVLMSYASIIGMINSLLIGKLYNGASFRIRTIYGCRARCSTNTERRTTRLTYLDQRAHWHRQPSAACWLRSPLQ